MRDEDVRLLLMQGGSRAEQAFLQLTGQLERERDEARAVLADHLEGKGQSWLAQLAGRRAYLYQSLRPLAQYCVVCGVDPYHGRECTHAELLRVTGGDVETQRQVDAAHEAARRERPTLDGVSIRPVPDSMFGIEPTSYSHWANSPAVELRAQLVDTFRAMGLVSSRDFADVVNPPTGDDE
jgi:hypothetical protein